MNFQLLYLRKLKVIYELEQALHNITFTNSPQPVESHHTSYAKVLRENDDRNCNKPNNIVNSKCIDLENKYDVLMK